MNKIITVVLVSSTLVFGGLYFSATPETQRIEVKNPLNEQLKSENARFKRDVNILEKKLSSLKEQLLLSQNAKVTVTSVPVASVIKSQSVEKKVTNPFLKMMSDPKVAKAMTERRNKMIQGRYNYLFKKLNLSDDDNSALVSLLGEKQMATMASYMKKRANRDDEEASASIEAEKEEALNLVDSKISDLLGDGYDVFTDYSEKRQEYDYLNGLNEKLEDDAKFSEAQTDQLATVMNDSKNGYEFSNEKFNSLGRYDVYKLDKDERTEYAKELEVRDELVLKDSADFLTEGQLNSLKERQERDRNRLTSRRGRRSRN
jgi:hypothetical protein